MKKYGKIIIIILGILVVIALIFLIYFKVTFISKNEVKNIITGNMNVKSEDVYFESIDFELDKSVYEVEIYYKNRDFEYKIDARSGKVIYTDFIVNNNIPSSNNTESSSINDSTNSNTTNNLNAKLTVEEAKNIALTHAKLDENNVEFLRTKLDYDDGVLVYEIDFVYNKEDYDYEIDANTGAIISFDRDSIYD